LFLHSINGSLKIANLTIQPLQRHKDFYIMDAVISSRAFSSSEIRQINYCRLYLQILTSSGMVNATGNRLSPGILVLGKDASFGAKASLPSTKSTRNDRTRCRG
jgi:hypothetical protein